jgi:hypothetical protein
MKTILPILLLAATLPAFAQSGPGKPDRPVVYDRNSRQVLPYDRLMPVQCPRWDRTPPPCASAEKPQLEKALKPKNVG